MNKNYFFPMNMCHETIGILFCLKATFGDLSWLISSYFLFTEFIFTKKASIVFNDGISRDLKKIKQKENINVSF